jgi:hypothetical protein
MSKTVRKHALMVHKGIRFIIQRPAGSDVWIWEYEIGPQTKAGRLHLYPREVAIKRIHQKIDRDIRELHLQRPPKSRPYSDLWYGPN